jgi:hypothetical protein
MKNVQVIDGGQNCTFSIFQATDEEFLQIFPGSGQDIEFIEDVINRLGKAATQALLTPFWKRPILKPCANGIHGTLFYQFKSKRKYFAASKRERDIDRRYINQSQRDMYDAENTSADLNGIMPPPVSSSGSVITELMTDETDEGGTISIYPSFSRDRKKL